MTSEWCVDQAHVPGLCGVVLTCADVAGWQCVTNSPSHPRQEGRKSPPALFIRLLQEESLAMGGAVVQGLGRGGGSMSCHWGWPVCTVLSSPSKPLAASLAPGPPSGPGFLCMSSLAGDCSWTSIDLGLRGCPLPARLLHNLSRPQGLLTRHWRRKCHPPRGPCVE